MLLKCTLCVALLLYSNTYCIAKTTIEHAELIEKGSDDKWVLIGPREVNTLDHEGHESEEDICDENEYEWTNGTCLACLQHNDDCEKSRQCCSVDNMSCWRVGSYTPTCKCDKNYGWDKENVKCVYIPGTSALFVTGCVALGAAVIIGAFAIIASLSKLCKRYYYRRRGDNAPDIRRQFRQNVRVPRQRRISHIEPSAPIANYPTKPPEYEEIFGAPTISQAMPRQLTGSIRSLPPAYTPCEENTETTAPPQEPEPMTSQTDEVTSSQSVTMTTETTSGVVNNGYEAEYHM